MHSLGTAVATGQTECLRPVYMYIYAYISHQWAFTLFGQSRWGHWHHFCLCEWCFFHLYWTAQPNRFMCMYVYAHVYCAYVYVCWVWGQWGQGVAAVSPLSGYQIQQNPKFVLECSWLSQDLGDLQQESTILKETLSVKYSCSCVHEG